MEKLYLDSESHEDYFLHTVRNLPAHYPAVKDLLATRKFQVEYNELQKKVGRDRAREVLESFILLHYPI